MSGFLKSLDAILKTLASIFRARPQRLGQKVKRANRVFRVGRTIVNIE